MTNRTITLVMTTGNDAFQTDEDVIATLSTLLARMKRDGVCSGMKIMDANGRSVGTVKVEDSDWSHQYNVKVCPECENDLTKPGGVTIETYEDGKGNKYLPSRLDDNGFVVDVDDVIENGLHSDTLCGSCTDSLNEYEVS